MNVPVDEVKEMMGEIGGRGMGYLFENMEKMDIQAERRNTQREKKSRGYGKGTGGFRKGTGGFSRIRNSEIKKRT